MSGHSSESGAVADLFETIVDAVGVGTLPDDTIEQIARYLTEFGYVRVPANLAVTRQSPGGRSLTYCCCDRTTARLVVCPVHPEATRTTPSAGGDA